MGHATGTGPMDISFTTKSPSQTESAQTGTRGSLPECFGIFGGLNAFDR